MRRPHLQPVAMRLELPSRIETSIERKLSMIVVAAVLLAVISAAIVLAWREAESRFRSKRVELDAISAVFASSLAAPLTARSTTDAARTLSAIQRIPGIRFAQIIDAEGRPFVQLGNAVVLERPDARVRPNAEVSLVPTLLLKSYMTEQRIVSAGREIGTLRIIADLSELRSVLRDSMGAAIFIGLLASAFALSLASRLQRAVIAPIEALTSAMQGIRRSGDYARAVERTSRDETGLMVDAFNDMLAEVRERDGRLARHRDRLEEEVLERTAELREATRAAERANAAKSDFLATMSHEIRTPLNGMLVMAELMAAGEMPPALQRNADVIVSSGQSLLAIINDILDLSKIESGRLELERLPVDVATVAGQVVDLFSARANAKGLALRSEIAPDVPAKVLADPVRLNQVLANLVNNALKFTERGGVTVCIAMESVPAAVGALCRVRFSVEDTGIGIPEDRLGAIFDAFSQADQSTTRKYGGTGIGLSISRKLVAAMGGDIGVESEVGTGSTFSFVIDCEVVEAACEGERVQQRAAASRAAEADRRFAGARILAADDNAVNREVLAQALARLDAGVTLVENGRAAVERFEAGTFDLVFMDCSMPEMDGYAATRAIRAIERARGLAEGTPIVALSAHVAGLHAEAWREAGMNGQLSKPFTLRALEACLEQWLPGRPSASASGMESCPVAEPPPFAGLPASGSAAEVSEPESQTLCASAAILDPGVLGAIRDMQDEGDDLVGRVIDLYLQHAGPALARIRTAAETGHALAEAAHALKSLCRNIGAVRLGDLLDAIEGDARSGLVVEPHRIAALPAELDAVVGELGSVERGATRPLALSA